MPSNQFFPDWVTGDIITAAKLNQMKNDVQPYLGYVPVGVDQDNSAATRYYLLGRVADTSGFLTVQGILGGHTIAEGRGNIDLQFSFRDGLRVDGYIMGTVDSADILVRNGGDGWAYVYLITNIRALVNLKLSSQGVGGQIQYNGTFTTTAPDGTTLYQLSSDFANNTHPNTLKLNNGVLRTRYDHQDRFVVDAYVGGTSNLVMSSNSIYLVRSAVVIVPSGKRLFLRRIRINLPPANSLFSSGVLARVETSFATYTSAMNSGDFGLDVQVSNVGSGQNFFIGLYVFNSNSNNTTLFPHHGYTAEFELR